MILSASRRTDIPCFYAEWFFNRLREGFFLVRNPMNAHRVSRVDVTPDTTECIVFWTKRPAPDFVRRLPLLTESGYPYYVQFTLTPYGCDIETALPDKAEVVDSFINLSRKIGKERIVWRYDPILLTDAYTVQYHVTAFESFAKRLSPYTDCCVISFVDNYKKIKTRMEKSGIHEASGEQMRFLARKIAEIGKKYGITIEACSEPIDVTAEGIQKAHCIDKERIRRITGKNYCFTRDKTQRADCGCVKSIDIGAYNTCKNGCIYCYATDSGAVCAPYDAQSPMLCGTVSVADTVTVRKTASARQTENELFW